MTKTTDRERAVALWRLANMLRCNSERPLWDLAEAADKAAIQYAEKAGTDYPSLLDEIENDNDGDLSGLFDPQNV